LIRYLAEILFCTNTFFGFLDTQKFIYS
jgi:hypothetical protein